MHKTSRMLRDNPPPKNPQCNAGITLEHFAIIKHACWLDIVTQCLTQATMHLSLFVTGCGGAVSRLRCIAHRPGHQTWQSLRKLHSTKPATANIRSESNDDGEHLSARSMKLQGSCHCGAVKFTVATKTPQPFMHCYCSICRKTQGGSGAVINIMVQTCSTCKILSDWYTS